MIKYQITKIGTKPESENNMLFNTKGSGKSSKSKFEGIIDSSFKALTLAGAVSITVTLPVLVYIMRHAIEAAFTANVMVDVLYFLAGFSVFFVIVAAYTIKSVANAYVKANALSAVAAKQTQAAPAPQIMMMPTMPQVNQKEKKQIEQTANWRLADIDDIQVVEAQSANGKPFVF